MKFPCRQRPQRNVSPHKREVRERKPLKSEPPRPREQVESSQKEQADDANCRIKRETCSQMSGNLDIQRTHTEASCFLFWCWRADVEFRSNTYLTQTNSLLCSSRHLLKTRICSLRLVLFSVGFAACINVSDAQSGAKVVSLLREAQKATRHCLQKWNQPAW